MVNKQHLRLPLETPFWQMITVSDTLSDKDNHSLMSFPWKLLHIWQKQEILMQSDEAEGQEVSSEAVQFGNSSNENYIVIYCTWS